MLSKKYYKDIAGILRVSSSKEEIIKRLCRYFELDNPRFDRDKFLMAVYRDEIPQFCKECNCLGFWKSGKCECFAPCSECGEETLHIDRKCTICGTLLK